MSRAAALLKTDTTAKAGPKSGALRVSRPGDSFEREADRVADTVARGGRLPQWSLAPAGAGTIQLQPTPPPAGAAPVPALTTGDILPKLAEAFLKTKTGQDVVKAVKADPAVKDVTDFVTTPAGIVVAGVAATGTVAALAAAHQKLPAQIPKIPLDIVTPGLALQITYTGPVNRPTAAALTISFSGKPATAKPKHTASETYRAETAAIAADQAQFRAGMQPDPQPAARPGPLATTPQTQEQRLFDQWSLNRLAAIAGPKKSAAEAVPKPPPVEAPEKKIEEPPVQRKAESLDAVHADPTVVEAALNAPSRPLDAETRRYMETRIGFDFSKVRLHTDDRAAASARALHAQAYTVGSDIVFGAGRYAPGTAAGRHLLAHELTHVVQQDRSAARPHPIIRPAPHQAQRLWGIEFPDVKAWLLGKLHELKGYPLFCLVIGQDLLTGEIVARTPLNLTQGVLNLFDGGAAVFEKLKQAAGAIDAAYHWVLAQIADLNLTAEYFSGLLDKVAASVHLSELGASWDHVVSLLSEPLDKLIALAGRLADKALDIILEAALAVFPAGKKVYGILQKAGAVIGRIAADPIAFGKNLFAAVQQGFSNFGSNIVSHLGDGLKRWIFEEINLPGLKMPDKFDFASIVRLVLQVLGLTYEQRRPQLVTKLGAEAVYFFESAVDTFTRIKREGFAAIWAMIKEKASDLFDSVIEGARNWVITNIVKLGLAHVAALATPIGDAIEIIKTIYETITFFIEKANKFVALIDSVVNSFADMAAGRIGPAAQKIEDTLANSIPLLLKFLADLLGLSGIGAAIRQIITDIRKPIDEAIGKVLDFVVDKAMPIWEKGKAAFLGKLAAIKEWWKKPKKFHYGEEEHEVTVEGEGDKPEVFIHSTKTPLERYLIDINAPKATANAILKQAAQLKWRQGDLQKPEDDAKGSAAYDKLTILLDGLKGRQVPDSKLSPQTVDDKTGGGLRADAYLTSKHDIGSDPSDTDPPIWNDLGDLRGKKSYIRGHLLSNRLGGQGKWVNMMPITNKVNQRMYHQVEKYLIKAVAKGGRFFHYVVKADYGDEVLPPLDAKATAAEKRLRAQKAEARIRELSWTVKAAKQDGNGLAEDPTADLRDADGNMLPDTVAAGGFKPPTEG
jgi:hypothetical protein